MSKKVKKFKDDGRTIANMNIEGMSWYVKNKTENDKNGKNSTEKLILTTSQKKAAIRGGIAAGFLIGGIFAAVFAAFALILQFLYF